MRPICEGVDDRFAGCGRELRYAAGPDTPPDATGLVEFDSVVDKATLVRSPELPGVFVSKRPVTYGEFERFLVLAGAREELTRRWIGAHAPLRRAPMGAWRRHAA